MFFCPKVIHPSYSMSFALDSIICYLEQQGIHLPTWSCLGRRVIAYCLSDDAVAGHVSTQQSIHKHWSDNHLRIWFLRSSHDPYFNICKWINTLISFPKTITSERIILKAFAVRRIRERLRKYPVSWLAVYTKAKYLVGYSTFVMLLGLPVTRSLI